VRFHRFDMTGFVQDGKGGRPLGRLRYLSEAGRDRYGHYLGNFLCDPTLGGCGKSLVILTHAVYSGNNRSCGCFKVRFDMTGFVQDGKGGRPLGRLRYLSEAGRDRFGHHLGNFLCDPMLGGCGKSLVVLTNSVHSGNSRSCRCLKDEQRAAQASRAASIAHTPKNEKKRLKSLDRFYRTKAGRARKKRVGQLLNARWLPRKTIRMILSQRFVEGKTLAEVQRLWRITGTVNHICAAALGAQRHRERYWYPWVVTWVKNYASLVEKIKTQKIALAKTSRFVQRTVTKQLVFNALNRKVIGCQPVKEIAKMHGISTGLLEAFCYRSPTRRKHYWYPWVQEWFKENRMTKALARKRREEHEANMRELEMQKLLIGLEPHSRGRDIA
jgi:hypothetical protein